MPKTLTPVDILNLRFRRSFRGYSVAEVDEFVRRFATDLETILTDSAQQRERLMAQERELAQFRSLETIIREALVLAQKAADETRSASHAQAEAIIHDAQIRARDTELQMQNRITELSGQIEELKQTRRRLARDFRAELTSQLAWLDQEFRDEPTPTNRPTTLTTTSASPHGGDQEVA